LYTKWFRFMSPLFPLFLFLASLFIYSLSKFKFLTSLVFTLSILPAILFFSIYFKTDIRLQASQYLSQNLSADSHLLSEAGNILNIPLTPHTFVVENFDFYNLDTNPRLPGELIEQIFESDYILIPSRRIFANQKGLAFPVSNAYYQALFSGQLGFQPVKKFSIFPEFMSDELAEETFSVFDHPVIRIYKKQKQLSIKEIEDLIL
ncbi:hypothetical protein DRH14_03510, partial [Candidatus Shapirobacteria bacterium]